MYLMQVAAVGYKPKSGPPYPLNNLNDSLLMEKRSPSMSTKDKSSSLPGYSNRGFHDAYSSSQAVNLSYKSPLPSAQHKEHNSRTRQDDKSKLAGMAGTTPMADPAPPMQGKKKKWAGWSGFFRRNKPAQQNVNGNSSDEAGQLAPSHPARHGSKQEEEQQQQKPLPPPPEEANVKKATSSRFLHPPRNVSKDRSPVVDTLSPLQSDFSASQTSLSRKERRDAILARAQARRNGSGGGSSSDEGEAHLLTPSPSRLQRRHHQSQESLTSNGSSNRAGHPKSRTGRTERYLQRRSRDEESLRREQQQHHQQQHEPSRQAPSSPSWADHDWTGQLNSSSSSSRRWLLTASSASSIPGPWSGVHHPEMATGGQRVAGAVVESPVTLRKPAYSNNNNNNNNSPLVGRAQSALVTHPKLSTPPPPPPRNPLKKSYLLQVQASGESSNLQLPLNSGRPTSYSFGELRYGQQQQQQQPQPAVQQPSLHDYQNVDQEGRLIGSADRSAIHLPLTSPVQRRVLSSSPHRQPGSPSRHHSAFFPTAKSPSPFAQQAKTPEQERAKPPWLSGSNKSSGSKSSGPPVREFWRSKEAQSPAMKSARERLAPFHLTGNGSVSSLNSDLSSPLSRDAATTSSGDCPPFYMATGNTLANINGPSSGSVVPPTPKRIPPVAHNNKNNNNNNNIINNGQQTHHVRELSQLKPSTDRHLEQAICELEQIYRSLKLDGDEDLLDRAERRDLPTAHQQLIHQQYALPQSVCSGSESGGDPLGGYGITSDLDTMMNWSISGSFENVAGSNGGPTERARTPSNRRSAVPDKVADDMAVRRLAAAARKSQANDPQAIAAQSGSYLLLSPVVTAAEEQAGSQDGSSRSASSPDEPDVIYDDVAYRQIRQANQSLRVAEPQPPFGIPIGPVTPASPSDYLHTCVTPEMMELRPLLHPTKYPDLIRDDLAFRNLRKDAGQLQLPPGPVNTDKLDDLLKETHSSKSLKKKRAVRSLSANIAQLIRKDAARPSGGGGVVDFNRNDDEEDERYLSPNPFDSRAQSLSDLLDEVPVFSTNNNNNVNKSAKTPRAVKQRSGLKRVAKTPESDDIESIVQRQVRPLASWVERAHLSDAPATSTETIIEDRVPALAKLYPTSALLPASKKSETGPDLEMDHLISELSECAGQGAGRGRLEVDSSGLQLTVKPPTGALTNEVVGSPAGHYWEESPLFQSHPQFHFSTQRSASPANSSDSGQVSCCAREVRQILHHQIRQEEMERERLASLGSGRKTSRTEPVAGDLRADKSAVDRSVASKGRPVQPGTTTPSTARDNPVTRKSSARKMSNNNETGNGSATVTAVEKRDERIARYKEERRKQLQARHQTTSAAGTTGLDRSSSSEDLPHEDQSYAKYKHRKQMQKQQLESRPAEGNLVANPSDVTNSNLGSGGIKRFIKRESPLSEDNNGGGPAPVRINRAARLRAAAASATPPPAEDKSAGQRSKRLSVPTLEISASIPSDGQVDIGLTESVVLRQKGPSSSSSSSLQAGSSREKDKSTKRKSNLNRALTDEQVLTPPSQLDSQDETGKRIRRRRTGEVPISASSADTDLSSSVDNMRPSPQPATDLRANLRKTSQPPAFIRPPVPETASSVRVMSPVTNVTAKEHSPSPGPAHSSVPWRTGKVASAVKTSEPIKTEELTARIEALTAMASQTVAKVDRLTNTPTPAPEAASREVNGAHPTPSGGVRAVASKLLNRVQPLPVSPLPVGRRPAKMESPVLVTNPVPPTSNVCSPAVKLSPAVPSTPQTPICPSKNRAAVAAVDQIDKTLAASPLGVSVRANSSAATPAQLGRIRTAETDAKPVDNGGPSSIKAVQGILKKKVEGSDVPSVRIRPEVSPPELYPILRVDEDNILPPTSDPVSILKKRFEETESTVTTLPSDGSPEPHSILKRPLSRDGSAESARSQSPVDSLNSILKRATLSPSPGILTCSDQQSGGSTDPRPILKKRSSTDQDPAQLVLDGPRPILKKKSSTDDEHDPPAHKPILKSGRRTSTGQLDLDAHIGRLRRTEREASPVATRELEASNQPDEERPEGEEPRQLSVAERINSMELAATTPSTVAPWRLPSRPNPPLATTNGVELSGPESILWRRKSLDLNHVVESNRTAGLVEAVNRHVIATHAQTNGNSSDVPASDETATKPETQDAEDEFDPSKLSLLERVKLFDRPPAVAAPVLGPSRPTRSRKAIARFLTQPITIREMEKALHLRDSTTIMTATKRTVKPVWTVPAIEVKEVTAAVNEDAKSLEKEVEETEASGLERIRGILRRKSTENAMETKSILRSKSPSVGPNSGSEQPKSILKRHSPDVADESQQMSSSSSSSCSEDVVVAAENDLAAQLLHVEQEAKNHPAGVQLSSLSTLDTTNQSDPRVSLEEEAPRREDEKESSPSHPQQEHSIRRETETIILESEGSSSGTETTTTVTFRLGGSSAGTTVKQSQSKIKSHKIALMEDLSETSVASRLAALQKSGDTDWRKRVSKPTPAGSSPSSATEAETDAAMNSDGDIPTKSSIADRLKVLEAAQKSWQSRVHEPDAARFTVAGKMGQRPASVHVLPSDSTSPISPLMERKKKAPKPVPLRIKAGEASDSSPGTPSTDDAKPPFNRSSSDPNGTPAKLAGPNIRLGPGKTTSRIVSVPRPDDETFTSFFASSSWSLATSSQSVSKMVNFSSFGDVTAEDFDRVVTSHDLIVERRSVNVQRRKNISRNPIKSLILRPEMLRDEYEEVDTGVAEREVQRIKLEQLAKNSHLAVEALAGLASKEDFSSIALKSAKEGIDHSAQQSKYLMQIKGRRQIQTRLVEPTYSSVNSGDCFILVTPTDVIQFVGRYANVIERARSSEVAQRIVLKKDLGSIKASQVQLIEEDKVGSSSFFGPSKRFWSALGRTEAEQAIKPAGPPEEDELYESAITSTNTVWQLDDDHLQPCEEHWGTILQTEILDPNKVMVFDFGCEMYVWSGKMAPLEARKKAMQLAKELWNRGYDYSECAINPVFQRPTCAEQSKGEQRPDWALLRPAKQHMEPVLFREKFFDWPDKSNLIKVKENDEKAISSGTDITSLEPYDAQSMLDNQLDDPDLELEGSHLGRGVEYYDQAERRLQQISTLSLKVWHLLDYEKVLMDDVSRGQFHSRDTYIIRWQYRITVTGKDLKGQPSVHGLLGRDRFCYFIWHGAQAPPTDQGASALKTVELDEERGPHVRVQQGHEPPAFLALFQGRMTVHSGKRGETDDKTGWRLYFVRGEKEEEAHLLQVRRCVQALRSRGSLLLINQSTGTIFLWHGSKSLKHTRQVAAYAAAGLRRNRPPELNLRADANSLTIKEQYEGAESREFWEGIGHNCRVADRSLYLSLAQGAQGAKENRYDHTPRLFHLTSWTGQFRADEVAPCCRFPQLPCPYPFVQEDLYSANQPTLFMLDNEHQVWLWQGWWPDQPDTENTNTGSGKLRLAAERRCAMETVIEYCRLKGDNQDRPVPAAYLVSAGLEPLAFTALFPYWTVDERVGQLNIQEGRSQDEIQSIQDVLDRLKRTTYSLNELQVRPPPEGVDPTKLESYLTQEDFQETMGMTKPEFYALPAWRQSQLRKETGLF